MRIFICSLIIFILLCTFVSINSAVYQSAAEKLLVATKNLPQEPDVRLTGDLLELWYKYEDFFNLTTNHSVTDQIELSINNLYYETDAEVYTLTKQALIVLLNDMKHSASAALDRIF